MFVLMYGAMIMNSVIEEKTNRIVEVVVSSCRPFQLMLGKIIGVGLVGLTQMAIWLVMLLLVGVIAGGALGLSGAVTQPMAGTTSTRRGRTRPGHANRDAATVVHQLPEHPGVLCALLHRRIPALRVAVCGLWLGS